MHSKEYHYILYMLLIKREYQDTTYYVYHWGRLYMVRWEVCSHGNQFTGAENGRQAKLIVRLGQRPVL